MLAIFIILAFSETQFQQQPARRDFPPAMPDTLPLHMLAAGQCARIDQLLGRPDEIHRLQELGMRVGTPIEMLQSGATCIVKLDETPGLSRSRGLSRLVRVRESA